MATTLHSFMDIFDTTFGDVQDAVQLKKIIIPIIQRDYAQGRRGKEVTRVRNRFLYSLYKAVTQNPITLDFIYGDIDNDGNMTPLDGQQRLTTLFLLHWYAAKKDNVPEDEYDFLNRFSYETRYSAREFCRELVQFNPEFKKSIKEEIVNESWFPLDWENDPTISSMLIMLDAIDKRFMDVTGLWDKLKKKCITFYFLPIKDMGLTDDLYIKMNSRGKPLTKFEHFKAELERELRLRDEGIANRIMNKIDRDWTDLLWEYRNSNTGSTHDDIIDDEFLRYFKFICDVISYKKDESPIIHDDIRYDEFVLLEKNFSSMVPDAITNIETMESFFDCWCNIPGYDTPKDFLDSIMTHEHENTKILVDTDSDLNIFQDCLHNFSEKNNDKRNFPLHRTVLLYAITTYLQNMDKVTESDFRRRIRIVNNLIQNSEDELAERKDRSRMQAILKRVDTIIISGLIDDTTTNDSTANDFNAHQLSEEKDKIKFLADHPEMADTLFELEDHRLLKGQISIVGLDNLSYTMRFESLFKCDPDKIDCAMMAIGDYGQLEQNNWRHQYGSTNDSAWQELFHKSANSGYENTKNILVSLLSTNKEFSYDILTNIAVDFLHECECNSLYPFRYYYIKYHAFRPSSYGKMQNNSASENPYIFLVMQTKTHVSENSYSPYLKAIADFYPESELLKDDKGRTLIFGDDHFICTNNSFKRLNKTDNSIIDEINIAQNNDGIDTEDRIVRLKNYIETTLNSR